MKSLRIGLLCAALLTGSALAADTSMPPNIQVSAGAKTGAYMTFQGGQVMDYGSSSSASISVGLGPISAGTEASARISAVSGVDVALDSGVHIGGVSPE